MTKTPEQMAEEWINKSRLLLMDRPLTEAFLAGYQAAVNSPEKPDTCEHILDMEKMVDVNSSNNSNGWISVKDRLPPPQTEVLWWNKAAHQAGVSSWEYMSHYDDTMIEWGDAGNVSIKNFTHWMPLPEPPDKEEE